jgi:3-isopropylmalate dehydratase small subunit
MRWGTAPSWAAPSARSSSATASCSASPASSQADLEWLQKAIERAPQTPVAVDVEKQEVRFGDRVIKATVPDGPRNQLVAGTWDSTAVLLEAGAAIEATAGKLSYVKGY